MRKIWNIRVVRKIEPFTVPQICFVSFDHQSTVAAQSYFISYLFIFLDFKSDMMRLCNEQDKNYIYKFSKESPCLWQIRYFNSILGPTAYLFRLLRLEL